jgi:hypothetical protein
MKPLGVSVWLLVLTLASTPAVSQTIRGEDLARFTEISKDQIRDAGSQDWDDVLYGLANSTRAPDAVVAEFARRIDVDSSAARDYISVILESVLYDDACGDERPVDPDRCVFAPGRSEYDRVAAIARRDRSGKLLIAVGKNVRGTIVDEAGFFTLTRSHPAASTIFGRLLEVRHGANYLLAGGAAGPVAERTAVIAAVNELNYFRTGWSRQDDSWRLALIEAVERTAATGPASMRTRAALAQTALWWKLELGLIDEAVASYYSYPPAVRSLLPLPMSACRAIAKACAHDDRYRLSDELAAALWLTGHKEDARRWLQDEIADYAARGDTTGRYRALVESFTPSHDAKDLFPLFMQGRLPGEPDHDNDGLGRIRFAEPGWLFQVRPAGTAVRRVVAARLRDAGYADMAASLETPAGEPRYLKTTPVLIAIAAMYPKRVHTRQEYWQTRIAAAAAGGTRAPAGTVHISTRDLPPWWTEKALPASIAAWRDDETPQKPPEHASLPVDPDAVVRYEERNGERALVYLSTEYDLPGETPAAGLWFARTVGGMWTRPLYLGLQQHFPYVVTSGSRLPMLDDGRLRVEVQVREIDTATITFPPVSLDLKRSADGLYLEFDLAALAADRDGDGLTDIEERRIGLDFSNADTDGDGIPDGRDPLPLVRYRPPSTREDDMAAAIVAQIFGGEPHPIVVGVAPTLDDVMRGDPRGDAAQAMARTRFLVGDPAIFASVAPRFRLIVYSPADVEALGRGAAPFYAPRIAHIFSSLDGTTHYVEWSAAWAGGSFMVTCHTPGKPCTVAQLTSWIT